MNPLSHWTQLVNTRVGSPVTDATVTEVNKARWNICDLKGPMYVKNFLKDGRKWRLWIDSEDILLLTYYVQVNRRLALDKKHFLSRETEPNV